MYHLERKLAEPRLGKESDGAIAKSLGVSRGTVTTWRLAAGIEAFRRKSSDAGASILGLSRRIRNAMIDPKFATDPADVIAARYGLLVEMVRALRVELGISQPREEKCLRPICADTAQQIDAVARRAVQLSSERKRHPRLDLADCETGVVVEERVGPRIRKREERDSGPVALVEVKGHPLATGRRRVITMAGG